MMNHNEGKLALYVIRTDVVEIITEASWGVKTHEWCPKKSILYENRSMKIPEGSKSFKLWRRPEIGPPKRGVHCVYSGTL